MVQFSSVQFSRSVVSDSTTPWIPVRQASLSITNSRGLPKPMSIESVMSSSYLILRRPLLLLPPILPSIRVFPNESTLQSLQLKYFSVSNGKNARAHHSLCGFFETSWSKHFLFLGLILGVWTLICGFQILLSWNTRISFSKQNLKVVFS